MEVPLRDIDTYHIASQEEPCPAWAGARLQHSHSIKWGWTARGALTVLLEGSSLWVPREVTSTFKSNCRAGRRTASLSGSGAGFLGQLPCRKVQDTLRRLKLEASLFHGRLEPLQGGL